MLIDQYISSGCYPTASFLAGQLERSRRTVLRDIQEMMDVYHAPIESLPGTGGYYYSEPNFFLKGVMLSRGELFSMALLDRMLKDSATSPRSDDMHGIFGRLSGAQQHFQEDESFFRDCITVIPEHVPLVDRNTFDTVFLSLQEHRTLEFDYRPLSKATYMHRKVNPYHAVFQRGSWYILALCSEKNQIRIFSLARMKDALLTDIKFSVPPDFRPEQYFDREMGVWLSSNEKFKVELLVSSEIRTFALDMHWHSGQTVRENDDGSVYVCFETTQLPEVKRWVLGQGSTVKVLAPPLLIEQVKETAESIKKLYSET